MLVVVLCFEYLLVSEFLVQVQLGMYRSKWVSSGNSATDSVSSSLPDCSSVKEPMGIVHSQIMQSTACFMRVGKADTSLLT